MPAPKLIPVRFLRNFGIGDLPLIANGRVILAHASHYRAGEIAGWPAEVAAALCKAGIAELVEPENDAV